MDKVILEVKGLSKSFGNVKAVQNLEFSVDYGEIFGFLGPNGAGKTTSIKMMCGLLKPDNGSVHIHGKNVYSSGQSMLNHVGICPQEIVIWKKLTCFEQLVFVAKMYGISTKNAKVKADTLLKKLGLEEKKNTYGKNLSGGMKRRLNILLGLVHDPDIVFLDEPEAGLDPQSRIVVRDFIQSLAQEKLVILTTHNMDEADRLADRIAVIDQGRLLVTGTSDELKKSIGDGDKIDFDMKNIPRELANEIVKLLQIKKIESRIFENKLIIDSKNMMEEIPIIIQLFKEKSINPGEMYWRQTTLEDVFISLTGRGLRQ